MAVEIAPVMPLGELSGGTDRLQRSLDRFAYAHDASHFLLVPQEVLVPKTAADVAEIFRAARAAGKPVTFRSGGTSLSGQSVTGEVMIDTRKYFRTITVEDVGDVRGAIARVEPGATVRQVNTRLIRHRRKLGPDPASEIACTIGGVIANNSSGMACGTEENSYQTIDSLLLVLPSGTVIDTGSPDADERLRELEPEIHAGLTRIRNEVMSDPELEAEVRRQFAMKNTMGYGINSLVDFDEPVKILEHLVIGSEGTLAFVAEARFRTVPVLPAMATGLLVFETLADATAALPALVAQGLATVELLDATSLKVAQGLSSVPEAIASLSVENHAAFLVEVHAADEGELATETERAMELFSQIPLVVPPRLTVEPKERASLWEVRKGLYTAIAGARPSGTTALLEDVVVPVERLLAVCEGLTRLFEIHGYENAVIFGHAKDGNVHFMLTERFETEAGIARHRAFVEDMVELILEQGGSLKAEHGTGRVMAGFVRRQYGDRLTNLMWDLKRLIDPDMLLNPGVVLSDDPDLFVADLKTALPVESEVDRCVECGYCEPTCPSKDLTLTPRQRIVLRRELAAAEQRGDTELVAELSSDYVYDGIETCAVDGMCGVACPVDIDTGDLVRRLRSETVNSVETKVWGVAAKRWGAITRMAGVALNVAKALPSGLVRGVTHAGRAVLGKDRIPLYDRRLPGGGSPDSRSPVRAEYGSTGPQPDVVFFASCIGRMFGAETGDGGARSAVRDVLMRAKIPFVVPENAGSLCCGTPWKSKGHLDGYDVMAERTLSALWEASEGGKLPVVCDAASCTEGVEVMLSRALLDHPEYSAMRLVDATEFLAREALPKLTVKKPLERIAVHPTCSTTSLGATAPLTEIASFVADEVFVADDWGCCGFAGDRGMLHPELTASATEREAAQLREAATSGKPFDAYVSANRTCEMGMARATGMPFRHVTELLDEVTRP